MANPTQEQLDAFDLEEHNIELIKLEIEKINAILQTLKKNPDKIALLYQELESVMQQINDIQTKTGQTNKKIESISDEFYKNIQQIRDELDSIHATDDKNIKKYLAEINIENQLKKYDKKRRGQLDKFLNNYTAVIKKKFEKIEKQINILMKNELFGSSEEDTEVQSSDDERGPSMMDVDTKLQQRVDDILKF